MRIKQGTFSTLPDLTDDEIKAQIQYCIDQGWAVSVEWTDDPHPRNLYWELWGMPMFDTQDASACFHRGRGVPGGVPEPLHQGERVQRPLHKQTIGLSFIINRPTTEPGFRLDRTELNDRHVAYTMHSYAAETPHGTRYQDNGSGPEPD